MLTFQEIGGSPVEKITVGGFSATRTFLVPWEQRNDFALAVFGDKTQSSALTRLAYPGRKDVYATSLRFEPFDADAVGSRTMSNLKTDLVDYDGSFARAVVNYAIVESIGRTDGPVNEEGTSISYRMLIDSDDTELPKTNWRWLSTFDGVGMPETLPKKIPYTLHVLTWSNVVDPPWSAISAAQGTINGEPFLGCATNTLLFLGGEAHKLYLPGSGIDDEPSSFIWSIKYTFRERSVKMAGNVYGWNHEYNPEMARYDIPILIGARLYETSDFNTLFRSVLPDDVP